MAEIINLNEYKAMKQREFFINLYHFLNKNLDYGLDHIVAQLDDEFIILCQKCTLDPLYVNYFRIPIITFIVITFINNSDIKNFFPTTLHLENYENKSMFKNTLLQVVETFEKNYYAQKNVKAFEYEMDEIIEKGLRRVLEIVPDKIILV